MKTPLTNNEKILNPEIWVEKYADQLFRYSFARVNDSELAKDLVQDVFLAAIKARDNFRGEISEINWLYAILKNKIIDFYRSKSHHLVSSINKLSDDWGDYFDDLEQWQADSMPKAWTIDYSQKMEVKEFYQVLEKCMGKLNEMQNLVFTMKYLDDYSSKEICKELGISSSNYWVLIHRAKLQIRQCLEKNWLAL